MEKSQHKQNGSQNTPPYRNLLIGKWEAVTEYRLIQENWHPYYQYKQKEYIYVFKEKKFVTYGSGYYKHGNKNLYIYDSHNQAIKTLEETIHVIKLTASELILEETINNFASKDSIRIIFKKMAE